MEVCVVFEIVEYDDLVVGDVCCVCGDCGDWE